MDHARQLMDRLYGVFCPIHVKWQEWAPSHLHLWRDSHTFGTLQILETDMRMIGEYFAHADGIGARSEYTLTAECIAWLRLISQNKPLTRHLLEPEIDSICRALAHESKAQHIRIGGRESPFEAPVSWRIARHVSGAGRCLSQQAEALHTIFQAVGKLFVLRDGNITVEEDEIWNRYDEAFV